MAGFREFYERFYHAEAPSLTTADELRDVVRAYKAFRLHNGLLDVLNDPEREAVYAARIEYHIGACELAELTGNTACVVKHRLAFMAVWELWFNELSGERPQLLPPLQAPKARRGTWRHFWQALKDWKARGEPYRR